MALILFGQYVKSIGDIKIGKSHLLITSSGFTFKEVESINDDPITVRSKNLFYESYDIPFVDLWEVWQYAGSFSNKEQEIIDYTDEDIKGMLLRLMEEVKDLKNKLS